jgi:hypothetical protein
MPAELPDRSRLPQPSWSWVPDTDVNGHPLRPGEVSLSFVMCPGCPTSADGRGHDIARYRVIGCDAPDITPPGHLGPVPAQH